MNLRLFRLAMIVVFVAFLTPPPTSGEELTFEKDIRPIFRAHCFDCHGATDDIKGGLDLRLVRLLRKGGESGAAIEPGNAEASFLLERIKSGEMPPGKHRVPDSEIAVVERWIIAGARTARPEPESIGPGLGITPEERSFWSFRPVTRPAVPAVDSFPAAERVRTPIDALVQKSMPQGVTFAADADRRTLINRAFFNLTGLPPSPEVMETWLKDSADDWYDRLLTDLMDSPHYGERWARHWLDVAGYADSEGYTNSDAERPWVWKYRDWVIRAFNSDKPFDRFIIEQLAGDELAGPQQGDLTPEQIDLLTATGFLRMAEDGTGSGADNAEARNKVMTDTLKIVGTSLLGLSIQCAQCHDHRYDPIPQTDYYGLRAIFEPALDWRAWKNPNARRISLYTKANREQAAELESQTKSIAEERAKKLAEYMKQALDKELTKYEEPLRGQLRTAYETPAAKRTDEHKALLTKYPSVNINPGNLYQYIAESRPKLAEFDKKIADIRAKKPVEQFLRALVEPANHAPETKLFHRGDHQQPKQTVAPASLTLSAPEGERPVFPLNDGSIPSTGRRLAFAKWLTSGNHPLLARVIVNRVWLHHFGRGIVETPADFGRLGVKPTHPELLDWLADEFMTSGWSLKKLHRLILTSTVWRQSASRHDAASATPLSRRRLIRLEAETIRDRMLAASGQLDRTSFGAPVGISKDDTGQIIVNGQRRRSLYVKARRSEPVAMLQAFDAPVMRTNCELRPSSTVATQSLMLMNGEFTLAQARHLANRAASEAVDVDDAVLETLAEFPPPPQAEWSYGYGSFDEATGRVGSYTALPHFTGSAWQGGGALPDPSVGWVFLNANGGHPDVPERSTIRRWTSPASGTVSIAGKLVHGSPNGDGVRGRVVSSRSGKLGEWTVHNGDTETISKSVAVETGDTIDFVTDCRENYTSDSFTWQVTVKLKNGADGEREFASQNQFRGPTETRKQIVGQIIRVWQLALCRKPSPNELQLAAAFVASQIRLHSQHLNDLAEGTTAARQAMTDVCHALFSSNEFLYLD